MEKWNAYKRDHTVTDIVLIRGEKIPEGLYHLVCEVLVKHTDGSYLLMKRASSKELYPSYYEATAGGSALLGEDKYECIERELYEETGIKCDEFEEVGFCVRDNDHAIMHSFVCSVDCDKCSVKLQHGETEDFKWLNETEFIDFINSDKVIDTQKNRYTEYFKKLGYIK